MRFLSIFALAVASCTLASATTVSFSCQPLDQPAILPPSNVINAGSTTVTCSGSGPAGAFTGGAGDILTNINLSFIGTFQDGDPTNGTHQLSFAGSSSQGGFAATNTSSGPGFGGLELLNFVDFNPNVASIASFIFTLNTASIGQSIPNSASYSVYGTYTYEVAPGIPEPSTLALVGGVLVLAGIRKFRP